MISPRYVRARTRTRSRDGHGEPSASCCILATTIVRQSGVKPLSTVEEGAEAILNLVVSEELDGCSGEFLTHLEHRPAAGSGSIEAPRPRSQCRLSGAIPQERHRPAMFASEERERELARDSQPSANSRSRRNVLRVSIFFPGCFAGI